MINEENLMAGGFRRNSDSELQNRCKSTILHMLLKILPCPNFVAGGNNPETFTALTI